MRIAEVGVFMNLVNRRAFLDKLTVAVRGIRKESAAGAVQLEASKAIGGNGRNYARKQAGVTATGNSFDLLYGPMRLIGMIPPMMVTLRSDRKPITAKEITKALDTVCVKKWRASISQVELTFDFTGPSVAFFHQSIFSSAHRFATIRDEMGRQTDYIGGRTSPWQVRIYQKTARVVRLEFVLRRPFLRQQGITKITELKKLSTIDLSRRVWLRELDAVALKSVEREVQKSEKEDVRRRILLKWFRDLPLRKSIPRAKKYFGAQPEKLTFKSPVDERLRRMQSRLVV
jgi:hypothetical protein